jgi:hypothetical protein
VRALLEGRVDDYEVLASTDDAGLDANADNTPGGG